MSDTPELELEPPELEPPCQQQMNLIGMLISLHNILHAIVLPQVTWQIDLQGVGLSTLLIRHSCVHVRIPEQRVLLHFAGVQLPGKVEGSPERGWGSRRGSRWGSCWGNCWILKQESCWKKCSSRQSCCRIPCQNRQSRTRYRSQRSQHTTNRQCQNLHRLASGSGAAGHRHSRPPAQHRVKTSAWSCRSL